MTNHYVEVHPFTSILSKYEEKVSIICAFIFSRHYSANFVDCSKADTNKILNQHCVLEISDVESREHKRLATGL